MCIILLHIFEFETIAQFELMDFPKLRSSCRYSPWLLILLEDHEIAILLNIAPQSFSLDTVRVAYSNVYPSFYGHYTKPIDNIPSMDVVMNTAKILGLS
jgi:hypothetical protein